jgi:hypothetical protein
LSRTGRAFVKLESRIKITGQLCFISLAIQLAPRRLGGFLSEGQQFIFNLLDLVTLVVDLVDQ